ncbi:ATP-binding protein [Nonomuraea sp. NPDC049758]|uniref:ATP-binding protein n=1 Tax=Nonomuraea sp. NPDC049758 TaxID=3154360 RepID=UPI003445C37E
MPTHFTNLTDAATLETDQFTLARRIIGDLIDHLATGVVHGCAGTGKTFAVQAVLEDLRAGTGPRGRTAALTLTFTSKPTMRLVAEELLKALTGSAPRNRSRFYLIAALIDLLTGPPRLLVIDEAQRMNSDCLEQLRHLHDHPDTRFALLYVGGDGCWEVLSREPMLRSRVFRRLPFKPLDRAEVPALIRRYHPIYHGVADELLLDVDDTYAHGTLRDWAAFTHTAADLCRESGRAGVDAAIAANAYTLLGGGVS